MSDLPVILPPGRRRELAMAGVLDDLAAEVRLLRDALSSANADSDLRPALDQLELFVRTAGEVLGTRGDGVDQRLVDDLANLAGTLELAELPSRDPEFGFTQGLKEVRGAQGQIALTLGRALRTAARELGLRPSRPALADALAAEVPRALFERGQLDGIARQLDDVVERLDALDAVQGDASAREAGMVTFYLGAMRVEVDLARLALKLGETTIDFAALARAAEAMATLTGDFLATLRAWAERASAAIRAGVESVRGTVRRVATGVRDAARLAVRRAAGDPQAKPQPPEPVPEPPAADAPLPTGFSAEAVRDLILAGRPVPDEWVPFVIELNFAGTDLADARPLAGLAALRSLRLGRDYRGGTELQPAKVNDLAPLAGLTALQSLNLWGTRVTDLAPLAGLTALRTLDLRGTPVPDVGPLAGLVALQSLDLRGTPVSDLAPLAQLTALQYLDLVSTPVSDVAPLVGLIALEGLYLTSTKVSDVAPLAGLAALQTLVLWYTRVSNVSPLAGLAVLQGLNLAGTRVRDIAPLAGLTALQRLDLWGTQVSDAGPLGGLTALRILDLRRTPVSDVAPLAGLTALRSLNLRGTKVIDVAPLAGLTALRSLDLMDTQVQDVSALRHLQVDILNGPSAAKRAAGTLGPLLGHSRGET